MNRRWTGMICVVAVLCVPGLALAGRHGGGRHGHSSRGKAAQKHAAVWLVDGVDSNSVSLAKSDRSSTTNLAVGFGTELLVKGQLGKLADVQVGMRADFTAMDGYVSRLAVYDYKSPAETPKRSRGGRHKRR